MHRNTNCKTAKSGSFIFMLTINQQADEMKNATKPQPVTSKLEAISKAPIIPVNVPTLLRIFNFLLPIIDFLALDSSRLRVYRGK